ncbi:centrosomal protein of 290 kDa-like [Polypterus senegalus]|uniref:centrosomal protein of 290 kDa-like n=1 Tax=Polypterus senegalus TaxID=55291 RepID=UPI001962DEBE|nr:centrosomal protein of 290 kDa-like [Polypterus senegalus]
MAFSLRISLIIGQHPRVLFSDTDCTGIWHVPVLFLSWKKPSEDVVQVQTELQPWLQKGLQNVKPKPENNPLSDLYSTLLQRYEKQMQFNKEQSDLILELYGRLQSQETQLQAAQDVVDQCNLLPLNRRSSGAGRKTVYTSEKVSACKCASQIFCDPHCHCTEFRVEIEKLQKENARLSKEKDILKMELALLDKDFFEEIEDLKFALQESAQLNQKYEKYIKQISLRYGLPVPGAYSYYSE